MSTKQVFVPPNRVRRKYHTDRDCPHLKGNVWSVDRDWLPEETTECAYCAEWTPKRCEECNRLFLTREAYQGHIEGCHD